MEVSKIVGGNLKRLRQERNLSLGQLATECGVSKVMLSQIEKGDTNPTINVIWKIANGLKVPYSALLDQQINEAKVIHKEDIAMQNGSDAFYHIFCYLANSPNRNFEVFQLELEAGHSSVTYGHSEKAREYVMVMEGTLRLTVGEDVYELNKDDAIEFVASQQHVYESIGNATMKAVCINFYPA